MREGFRRCRNRNHVEGFAWRLDLQHHAWAVLNGKARCDVGWPLYRRCAVRRNGFPRCSGPKGRLQAVAVQYKILGDKPSAIVKISGYN